MKRKAEATKRELRRRRLRNVARQRQQDQPKLMGAWKIRPSWTHFKHQGRKSAIYACDGDTYKDECDLYLNSRYLVAKYDDGAIIHLSIKSLDCEPLQDWRDLQRIKNELLGKEVEAVQLYPAESRLLDMCDQMHLWALKEGQFPFGFQQRMVSEGTILPGQSQRPFEDKPKDLMDIREVNAMYDLPSSPIHSSVSKGSSLGKH